GFGVRGFAGAAASLPFAFFSPPPAFSDLGAPCGFASAFGVFCSSDIDLHSRTLGDAHFAALGAFAHHLETDARGLARLRVAQRHVRHVDWRFLGDHAAIRMRNVGLGVALDHVHAFDDDALFSREHAHDFARAAFVLAGDDDNGVVLAD